MRSREVDAVARKPEGGLHQPLPRQQAVLGGQRGQPCGQSRDGARGRTHRVVNELRAERDVEVQQLRFARFGTQAGHGDEAVEIANPTARSLVVDRVAAAQQSRHHRLGDT